TTALVTFTFTGCSSGAGTGECQSSVSKFGEIVTKRLTGTLGYLNKKHTAVGLDLVETAGGPMIGGFCGEDVTFEVFGSLIGKVAPLNTVVEPGSHMTLKFAQKEGHQRIKRLL